MNKQTIRLQSGAIAAGARTANLLQGQLIQYPGDPSVVRMSGCVPAAASGDGLLNVTIGGRNVTGQIGQVIPVELSAGRGPDAQLGYLVAEAALGSDLLEVVVVNQDTANAIAAPGATILVEIDPIA